MVKFWFLSGSPLGSSSLIIALISNIGGVEPGRGMLSPNALVNS